MGAFLKHRQATGLIVCLAIVLQWLTPAWAGAATQAAATPWATEICRSSPAPAPAQAPASSHSLKHCLFCASSSDTPAAPASPLPALPLPSLSTSPPAIATAARLPPQHWHPAQPRAPPALS